MIGGPIEEFAKLIVSGACQGSIYVKYPSWYDVFLLYRMFAPNVLNWTFRLLLSANGSRRTSLVGTGMPVYEGSASGRPLLEERRLEDCSFPLIRHKAAYRPRSWNENLSCIENHKWLLLIFL